MRILQMTLDAMKMNHIKTYNHIIVAFFLNCVTCNSDKKQNELNSFK